MKPGASKVPPAPDERVSEPISRRREKKQGVALLIKIIIITKITISNQRTTSGPVEASRD
jgi:hypothetical protein